MWNRSKWTANHRFFEFKRFGRLLDKKSGIIFMKFVKPDGSSLDRQLLVNGRFC